MLTLAFLAGAALGAIGMSWHWQRVLADELQSSKEQLIVLRARAVDLRYELDGHIDRTYHRWESLCVRLAWIQPLGEVRRRR